MGQKQLSPQELIYGSPRVLAYDEVMQYQHQCDDAVLLKENRLRAAMHAARYQQALHRYHSRKVHARSLEEGDLLLRCVQSAKGANKLTPKWEVPYRVVRVTRPGAVRLETGDGTPLPNSWNIEHGSHQLYMALPKLHVTPCTSRGDDPVQEKIKKRCRAPQLRLHACTSTPISLHKHFMSICMCI